MHKLVRTCERWVLKRANSSRYWKGSESHSSFTEKTRIFTEKVNIEPLPICTTLFEKRDRATIRDLSKE